MPGGRHQVGGQVGKREGDRPRGLRRVDEAVGAGVPGDAQNLPDGLDRPGHVRRVDDSHQPCFLPDGGRYRLRLHGPVGGRRHHGHADARFPHSTERPHHRVVLHGGRNDVVAAPQDPLDRLVQGLGGVSREHEPGTVLHAEKLGEPLPRHEKVPRRSNGERVARPARVSRATDRLGHRLGDPFRLGQGGCGVVQVDE